MNPYANEDVMWQRLKDIQREMENSRLYGTQGPSLLDIVRQLGRRVWWLANDDGGDSPANRGARGGGFTTGRSLTSLGAEAAPRGGPLPPRSPAAL